jgi:uncharacterized membrane protein
LYPLPSPLPLAAIKIIDVCLSLKGFSAFLGSFGIKSAEYRLAFPAAAFRALILFFLSLFQGKGKRVFLFAFLTLELVVWHFGFSFLSFCQLFVPRTAPLLNREVYVSKKDGICKGF